MHGLIDVGPSLPGRTGFVAGCSCSSFGYELSPRLEILQTSPSPLSFPSPDAGNTHALRQKSAELFSKKPFLFSKQEKCAQRG